MWQKSCTRKKNKQLSLNYKNLPKALVSMLHWSFSNFTLTVRCQISQIILASTVTRQLKKQNHLQKCSNKAGKIPPNCPLPSHINADSFQICWNSATLHAVLGSNSLQLVKWHCSQSSGVDDTVSDGYVIGELPKLCVKIRPDSRLVCGP